MKRMYLFPGQGAQYPGMGIDFWKRSARVQELFQRASSIARMDLYKILAEGTEEELKSTQTAQVVITLVNLSVAEALRERGNRPDGVAGFSLGEYAALAEAGILSVEDTFRLVQVRGTLMEQVSRKWDRPEGPAGMAAVIGLEADRIEEALAGLEEVFPANYNSPLQTVVSGTARGLALAEERLKKAGRSGSYGSKCLVLSTAPFCKKHGRSSRLSWRRLYGRILVFPSIPTSRGNVSLTESKQNDWRGSRSCPLCDGQRWSRKLNGKGTRRFWRLDPGRCLQAYGRLFAPIRFAFL